MNKINKENMVKQKIGHVNGTKAFARISYDNVRISNILNLFVFIKIYLYVLICVMAA